MSENAQETKAVITVDKETKRMMKDSMRIHTPQKRSKVRYLVSVWLDTDDVWMEDMRFRYIEDAQVHAARWGRIYGATVTQITKIEV